MGVEQWSALAGAGWRNGKRVRGQRATEKVLVYPYLASRPNPLTKQAPELLRSIGLADSVEPQAAFPDAGGPPLHAASWTTAVTAFGGGAGGGEAGRGGWAGDECCSD